MILDLVLRSREELLGKVVLQKSLGCNDHHVVEFKIFMAVKRSCSNDPQLQEGRFWPL